MNNEEKCIKSFKELGQKYGFPVITLGNDLILTAKNTDNEDVNWIFYNPIKDTISFAGNTDNCNIWLYETRKDFTPEKIIRFINDLNNAFGLKDENKLLISELIDPEDWQEIARVHDAYDDVRYHNK